MAYPPLAKTDEKEKSITTCDKLYVHGSLQKMKTQRTREICVFLMDIE
jgi:hypothetical protein